MTIPECRQHHELVEEKDKVKFDLCVSSRGKLHVDKKCGY